MNRLLSVVILAAALSTLVACDALSLPGSASADLLFSDSFSPGAGGRWRIDGDDSAWSALMGDQLVIGVNNAQTVQYATLDGETFADFVLEVDATLAEGNPANSYGILFRISGPNQFYRFEVTGAGFFTVERHDGDGAWTRLTDGWEEAAAINQGLGATNRLRVAAVGESLTFAINGHDVATLSDAGYSQGGVALDAGTFGRPGVQAIFDDLIVLRP